MDLSKEYWDQRYVDLETGWDVGHLTTPLKEYFDQISNKKLRLLVPGSGNGHEAEYLHKNEFINIFVLDYSKTALTNFKNRVPDFPVNQIFDMDFFELSAEFDVIIEQTFFCAIDIDKRKSYVKKMHELLSEKGKLVGLFFDDKFDNNHPPFGSSKSQYLKLLEPLQV